MFVYHWLAVFLRVYSNSQNFSSFACKYPGQYYASNKWVASRVLILVFCVMETKFILRHSCLFTVSILLCFCFSNPAEKFQSMEIDPIHATRKCMIYLLMWVLHYEFLLWSTVLLFTLFKTNYYDVNASRVVMWSMIIFFKENSSFYLSYLYES